MTCHQYSRCLIARASQELGLLQRIITDYIAAIQWLEQVVPSDDPHETKAKADFHRLNESNHEGAFPHALEFRV
jgi:hypothetical protein